jgi:hypothetical protein
MSEPVPLLARCCDLLLAVMKKRSRTGFGVEQV